MICWTEIRYKKLFFSYLFIHVIDVMLFDDRWSTTNTLISCILEYFVKAKEGKGSINIMFSLSLTL